MIFIFEKFTYEELDSDEAKDLLKIINNESSVISEFLLFHLKVIDYTLEELNSENVNLVQTSAIKDMLKAVFMAKKIITIIEQKKATIKITSSELESILINAKSLINGIEKVAELNKKHMLETDPSELLVYLSI